MLVWGVGSKLEVDDVVLNIISSTIELL